MTRAPAPPFDPVAWWARNAGGRVAVIDAVHARHVTYAALHCEAERWRGALVAQGIRSGDRVAVLAHNRYEFLPLFVACLRAGAVLVPLNWRLSAPELTRVLQHADPAVLFGESRFNRYRAMAGGASWIDLDDDLPAWLARGKALAPDNGGASGDSALAMLLYTSGTTGAPKGVMISHRQLQWNAISTMLGWQLSARDVAPVSTPFFHTAAWHVFTTPLLYSGGCVVVFPNFQAEQFLGLLASHAVTRAFCVPTQLHLLQQAADFGRPLPALRTFIAGGAPLPARTAQVMRQAGYIVRDAYGLTECGPNCFVMPDEALSAKPGAVGWPLPFLQMRVLDSAGNIVAGGEVGELQLRAPQLFEGYYRDAASTAEAMTHDGWLRTGDLVSVDDDGAYRVRGRSKDMFISGGENVFPGEVEAALASCAGVGEVAVVGIPDVTWGEVGCAVIVPVDAGVRADDVLRDVRARLADYKVPKQVRLVSALPTLGSGKVDREALRSLALTPTRGEH
jgi:fatty-acyl-CoA synthase